jgi:hypothetical protein
MTVETSGFRSVGTAGVLVDASLLTFLNPASWVVALAGFVARGGIVVLMVPILVIPSLSGLVTTVGPLVNRVVLGGVDADVAIVGLTGVAIVTLVVVGLLLVGGATDGWLIDLAADDLGIEPSPASDPSPARLAAARAIACLPLVVAVVIAVGPIVAATYGELLVPGDLGTPVAFRVVARIPGPIAIVVAGAIASEVLAALAVREVALGGAAVLGSLPRGIGVLVRRPVECVLTLVGSIVVTVILLGPAMVAAGVAFEGLARLLADDAGSSIVVAAVVLLVATWLGGLFLAAIAAAWRSFAWTAVHARALRPGPSRGWQGGRLSGTLTGGR